MRNRDHFGVRNGIVAAALAVLVVLVSATGCGSEAPQHAATVDDRAPLTVATSVAERVEIERATTATGTVEPWARVSPGTKIMGRVQRVPVREGDRVRKGAVLAELEKRDLEAAVAQARAAVAMAEANVENAGAQHRRIEDLHARKSATDKNLEDARAGHRVAEAALAQAEANLAAAEVALDYAVVRSPVAGWVVAKRVEAGDMASPGMPMFVVEDLSRVKIAVEIPESDVVGVTAGAPAWVGIEVLDKEWNATVDRVMPSGDPVSRTYRVQLVLQNEDGALKPGMFARTRFAQGTRTAMVVPGSALVRRGQLVGVYVVDDDGLARLRWVRVRDVDGTAGDRYEVLSGLEVGETYLTAPPAGFADATPVVAG